MFVSLSFLSVYFSRNYQIKYIWQFIFILQAIFIQNINIYSETYNYKYRGTSL